MNAISFESTSWYEPKVSSLHIDHRVTRQHTAFSFLNSLVDRRNVFTRNRAALDLVRTRNPCLLVRLQRDDNGRTDRDRPSA